MPERIYAFMRYRWVYVAVTVAVYAVAIGAILLRGFALGIDFTGGSLLERHFDRPLTAADVRSVLQGPSLVNLGLSGAVVQPLEEGRTVLIRTRDLSPAEVQRVDGALREAFGNVEDRRTEVVGPVIGQELVEQALFALAVAIGGILVYVTLRFEYRSGIAAVLSLIHDGLVVAGMFALARIEVNVASVAALLTILGYSINDTIVVFDRIRELVRRSPRRFDVARLVDTAITQTLPRTINTVGTTLVVVLALLLLGGSTLRDFMLALFVGIGSGMYSSVFVACAVWTLWMERSAGRSGRGAPAQAGAG